MRIKNEDTNAKYYNFLVVLKEKLDNGEIVSTNTLSEQYRISKHLCSELKKLNVLQGRGWTLKWNEKIPPSMVLVKKIRKNLSEYHTARIRKNKQNNKTLFDIPQTPLPKTLVKSKPKVIKTQLEKFNDDFSNYLSISEAVSHYGKCESTIRSAVRLAEKKEGALKYKALKNGSKKIYISIDYLDSIFNKKILKDIKYVENCKVELGVIRKFLKWLW